MEPSPTDAPPPPEARAGIVARVAGRVATRIAAGAAAGARAAGRRAGRALADAARWAWARRPSRARTAAGLAALAIAALSLGAMSFQGGLAGRLPDALDWRAAAALLDRDARPGDAVVLAPAWAERARAVLPARVPVLALPRVRGEDLLGVRRVWLLSAPDAPGFAWDADVDLLERASRSEGPERLGALDVTRYDLASPALPLAYLPDRLASADVTVGDAVCAADASGTIRCPGPAAVTVAREVRDVDGIARPCLVASPNPEVGAPLSIAFSEVPMGRAIRVHAAALAAPEAPLRLAVQVDGEEVGAAELSARGGWSPLQIDTTRHAGRARTVALVLTGGLGKIGARPAPAAVRAPPVCLDAATLP